MNKLSLRKFHLALPLSMLATLLISTPGYGGKPAEADRVEVETIKIVSGKTGRAQAIRQTPEYKALKRQDAEDIRKLRLQMRKQGYVVASPEDLALYEETVNSPYARPVEEVQPRLAFSPTAFELGYKVIGVIIDGDESTPQIHSITSIVEHPTLGIIAIGERNFATEESDFDMFVQIPVTDQRINGRKAIYTVYKSEDGTAGKTSIYMIGAEKRIDISVGSAILENEGLYPDLIALAQSF